MALAVAASLASPPVALAQLSLPGLEAQSVEIPLSRNSSGAQIEELRSREEEFLQRLDGLQARSRWQIERLENRRRWLDEQGKGHTLRLQQIPPPDAPARRLALAELLANHQELDGWLRSLEDGYDTQLRTLMAAAGDARRLRQDIADDDGATAMVGDEVQARLDAVRSDRQESADRLADFEETRRLAQSGLADHKKELARAQANLLKGHLLGAPELDILDVLGVSGEAAERWRSALASKVEPESPEEQELFQLLDELVRLRAKVLESSTDADLLDLELLAIEIQRQKLNLAILEFREGRLTALRETIAAREQGGLLSSSGGLLDAAALAAALEHTQLLASSPRQTLVQVQQRAFANPVQAADQGAGNLVLGLALLGVLGFVLGRRMRPAIARLESKGPLDAVVLAGLDAALPWLPLTLLSGTLSLLDLVPEGLASLYRFAALGPPALAAALATVAVLFPQGADDDVARYLRRLLRWGAAGVFLVLLLSALLPVLGYPEEVRALVRAVLGLCLLVGWVGIMLRKQELLALFGADAESAKPGVLRAGLSRFYRVIALGPVVVYVIYAVGYLNLARFLVRGGMVTLLVLLCAPWAHLKLRELSEQALGYPSGGGWLALSAEGARTGYRVLAPLLLLGVGGVSLSLAASGWGYGDLFGNLVRALTYPLLDVGGSAISASSILLLGITVALTFLLSRWVIAMLQRNLYPLYDLDRGMRTTLDTIVRYAIFVVGTIVGLDVVGVGIGFLTVFAGVVGIGVGFGSQTLASNFISGLILLLTRPAAVDDVIELEGVIGRVVRISSYATVVRTLDNLMVIIPNSNMLEGHLINWTVGDRRVRLSLLVGVAYGSDVNLARDLLLEAAASHSRVLRYPASIVRFDEFGDSSLQFTLMPWTDDPDHRFITLSDLRFEIDRLFRSSGIEIAFPQRDLNIRGGDGVIRVAIEKGWEVRDEDGDTIVPGE
jgi:small-conductance mechanosensitive channel